MTKQQYIDKLCELMEQANKADNEYTAEGWQDDSHARVHFNLLNAVLVDTVGQDAVNAYHDTNERPVDKIAVFVICAATENSDLNAESVRYSLQAAKGRYCYLKTATCPALGTLLHHVVAVERMDVPANWDSKRIIREHDNGARGEQV